MIKHIQQRGYADCGVACIAMAAGVDYERVLGSVAPDVYFHGMYWGEILHALKKISGKDWTFRQLANGTRIADAEIDRPAILYVERDFQYTDPLIKSHYIYCKDGLLYDPTMIAAEEFNFVNKTIVGSWKILAVIFLEEKDS